MSRPATTIIVPTTRGREESLALTLDALRATVPLADVEILVPRDYPTVGQAWSAGLEDAHGARVCLYADDMIAHPGWYEAAHQALDADIYPSPRLLLPDGGVQACGSLGGGLMLPDCPDGTECLSSDIPFLPRDVLDRALPPIHYYSDDFCAVLARRAGLLPEVVRAYQFTHMTTRVGTDRVVARAQADRARFLREVVTL